MRILLLSLENTLVCFGTRQIGAALKKEGHEVETLFLPREYLDFETEEDLKRIEEFVRRRNPELIGMSLMSSHIPRSKPVLKALRKGTPAPVMSGGIHPILKPEECIEWSDYVCLTEGEDIVPQFVEKLESDGDVSAVPGFFVKSNRGIYRNAAPDRNPDINRFPLPDFGLETQWIMHQGKVVALTPDIMRNYVPGIMDAHYVISSRGCPYACTYCCNNALRKRAGGPYLRRRSPEHFVREMTLAMERFDYIKGFVFMDDSFLSGSDRWFDAFCELYQEKIDLPFFCWANPAAVKESVIEKLVPAGLVGVHVGLQSGSRRIAYDVFNRKISVDQFLKSMEILAKYKDKIVDQRVDVITDNPYETEDDTMETIRVLSRIKQKIFVGIVSLIFYPETDLAERAVKEGKITDDGAHVYNREFFYYEPTYLNRIMRTIPVTPSAWILFFAENRKKSYARALFYLYYFGWFVPFRVRTKRIKRRILYRLFKKLEKYLPPHYIVKKRVELIDF